MKPCGIERFLRAGAVADRIGFILEQEGLLKSADCLACDVCCRFPESASLLAPYFCNRESDTAVAMGLARGCFPPGCYGPGHAIILTPNATGFGCPAFRAASNDCRIYEVRPLDCRLYPFMLMFDPHGMRVLLGLDTHCPVVNARTDSSAFAACVAKLAALLEGPLAPGIVQCRGMVSAWKDHVLPLREVPSLTTALCDRNAGLARLVVSAMPDILPFFRAHGGRLTTQAPASIMVWSDIFDLYWRISGERLLVFAEGEGDIFLITPPVGCGDIAGPAEEALDIMRRLNSEAPSPRIQDVGLDNARRLVAAGWRIREQTEEYIYTRGSLAELRGNRFEKKRQMCNRFARDHEWEWRPFAESDFPAAVTLVRSWLQNRLRAHRDPFFTAQAEATFRCVYRCLREADEIGLAVRILLADGHLASFTCGFPLCDGETFCVLFEIADLRIRGAAQFMYRELCREAAPLKFINAGSASGLPGLARVKESYRPCARLPSHVLGPSDAG